MTNTPLISVIVPVYKVERYLPRCIESILKQTYTNFELILVDDGTPDRSGIICDRYAEKDSRIRVIHKENGGVSTARNAGIDAAKGEWITFIDSDDWVSSNYLESLYSPLLKGKYELIVGLLELRSVRVQSYCYESYEVTPSYLNSSKVLELVDSMEFCGPCHKLFYSEIMRLNKIRFPEGVKVAEDTIFVNEYLLHCEKIFVTGETIYYYNRLNDYSVTRRYPYFEERTHWDVQIIESYKTLLQKFGVSCNLVNDVILNKTLDLFCPNVRTIINAFSEGEAKFKILGIIPYYKEYFSIEPFNIKSKNEKNRPIIQLVREEKVDGIFNHLSNKFQTKDSLKIKVKRLIKKTIKPFIEKYRDGLVKFKF